MEFVEDYLSDKRRKEIEAMKIYNPLAQVTYDNINFAVIKSIDEKYILIPLLGYGNYFREFGIHEVDAIIRRNYSKNFDLKSMILENGYDTVVIAYAQSMIGRHVDPSTSGYRMFIFD